MKLTDFRLQRAVRQCLPIYCVLADTVLKSIASLRPDSPQALMAVRGMSEEKCALYGDDLLRIVNLHRSESPLFCEPPSCRGVKVVHPRLRKTKRCEEEESEESVYILELMHGRVYVGKTRNTRRRLREHIGGTGSAFTREFPPTGVLLPRLGRVSGSGEAAERDETLRYMYRRGINLVRGWKYTRVIMTDAEKAEAEGNIRELFNLCRRCGHTGHFVSACKQKYDRNGTLI